MKKILSLALPLLLAAVSARAELAWYEGFQYTNGLLTTSSGGTWIRTSGTGNDMFVNNSNLQVAATGGSPISRQDDCYRLMTTNSGSALTNLGTVIYASFTVICTNLPNGPGSYFATFDSTSKGFCGRVQAFTNGTVLPKTWRLGVTANGLGTNSANGGFPVDLALNTPYQVVEELDPVTLQAATIWVNPIDMSDTGLSGSDPKYTSSDSIGFQTTNQVNAYLFRQASSFGNSFFLITNLAVATTFPEAATNVWATNAVAPTIVYQPVGVTNYTGASISLSAVANGQGLGSLTYQWLRNGSPYPSGNGANVLNIASAQPGDSGDFKLVVTTPYGLSVTSGIAKVLISNAPVPPQFVVQPVSKTVYNGQSVTFTAQVISPGNVFFTWYSNNIIVSDGVTTTASSSSLQLNNLQTNASGSVFRVEVGNDVVPTVVASTNAVLTVLNPPVVSIAYLRTLVDPATYLPTNLPPTVPYQVTGTVTTLTNITTGDTSSYYLQDGTAGINIFVTGGTTFRPALGDVVTFIGVLSTYTSGLELYADATVSSVYPYTSFTVLSNNIAGLPAPQPIPYTILNNPSNANYNLGGRYVQISDVHFGASGGTTISTTANQTVAVTNSLGQPFNLFFPAALDTDVAGQTLPNYAYTVSGIVYSANSVVTNTLLVTRFSDINTTAPSIAGITITSVSNSGGSVTLNWAPSPAGTYTYSVWRQTSIGGAWTTLQSGITGTSYTDTGATAGTGFYRVSSP